MGFYVRKSFKAGPFRLNLSKSGLGLSGGIKGARIGVDAKGRTYTHAGRYGLYHRQYLSGRTGAATARAAEAPSLSAEDEAHIVTDATYPTRGAALQDELTRPSCMRIVEPSRPIGRPLGVGFVVLLLSILLSGVFPNWLVLLGVVVGLGFAAQATRNLLIVRARDRLERALAEKLDARSELADADDVPTERLPDEDVAFVAKAMFRDLTLDIVEDGHVDAVEHRRMAWCQSRFSLDPTFVLASKVAAFQRVALSALSDHQLTEEEQATLDHVQSELDIPDCAVLELRATVSELAEVRKIREGEIHAIDTSQKLQKEESCYFEAPGRLLKYNIVKRFTKDGVRHKVRGFQTAKEGVLLLTSKRVTLRHDGTTNVPYAKIVSVEVDSDQNLVTVVKDGAQKPIYLSTPRSLEAGALIAQLSNL